MMMIRRPALLLTIISITAFLILCTLNRLLVSERAELVRLSSTEEGQEHTHVSGQYLQQKGSLSY